MSNNRLTHAYIVCGGVMSSPFVRGILSEILCSGEGNRPCGECIHCGKIERGVHPDITVIEKPDGKKEIQVDQIRDAVFGASLLPNEAERRVIVVADAENMNINAQNALLKLLEEPPKHVVLLLLSDEPGALLPTVRSRCRIIEAEMRAEDTPEDIEELAGRYVERAYKGGETLVEFSFELDKVERQDFALFLPEVRRLAAKDLRYATENRSEKSVSERAQKIIEISKKAEEYLARNVGIMHISSMLCAFIGQLD